MNILVIDNYDSFTFNLVHYLEEMDCTVTVKRNDQFAMDEVAQYDKVVLSPGPGIPEEAGLLKDVIERYAQTIPMLGVCLGHQAIAEVFGGALSNLATVFHGVSSSMKVIEDDPIFDGLPKTFDVGRYHSWVVNKPLPKGFILLAEEENGQVMAFKHDTYPIYGVQFHPESILTPNGKQILQNWLAL
ncbi:MAG: aminodeoxychorismate/anthranilate synthase component II, partial [Flavobacteriaceae bacterium]